LAAADFHDFFVVGHELLMVVRHALSRSWLLEDLFLLGSVEVGHVLAGGVKVILVCFCGIWLRHEQPRHFFIFGYVGFVRLALLEGLK
jgi:hypothetical protein